MRLYGITWTDDGLQVVVFNKLFTTRDAALKHLEDYIIEDIDEFGHGKRDYYTLERHWNGKVVERYEIMEFKLLEE
jgi:hypothetical protein